MVAFSLLFFSAVDGFAVTLSHFHPQSSFVWGSGDGHLESIKRVTLAPARRMEEPGWF